MLIQSITYVIVVMITPVNNNVNRPGLLPHRNLNRAQDGARAPCLSSARVPTSRRAGERAEATLAVTSATKA
jgi:hypothetical protein